MLDFFNHNYARRAEKIELVRRQSGLYGLDHAVTRTQKIILSCFGMNEEDVRRGAASIAASLAAAAANQKDNNEPEEDDDAENEICDVD